MGCLTLIPNNALLFTAFSLITWNTRPSTSMINPCLNATPIVISQTTVVGPKSMTKRLKLQTRKPTRYMVLDQQLDILPLNLVDYLRFFVTTQLPVVPLSCRKTSTHQNEGLDFLL